MDDYPMMLSTEIDPILLAYQDDIEDFAYVTGDIYYLNEYALDRAVIRTYQTDLGK